MALNYLSMVTYCGDTSCCSNNTQRAIEQVDIEISHCIDASSSISEFSDDAITLLDAYGKYAILFVLFVWIFVFLPMIIYLISGICRSKNGMGCATCVVR